MLHFLRTTFLAYPNSYCSPTLHISKYFLLKKKKFCLTLTKNVIKATGKNGHITNFLIIIYLIIVAKRPAADPWAMEMALQSKFHSRLAQ